MPQRVFDLREAGPADYALLPDIERDADEMFRTAGIAGTPPIGFVRIIDLQGQPHLEQLSVYQRHGRMGIGSALLAAAIAKLRDHGYSRLTLMTFEDVPWNAPFYRKRGFRTVEEITPSIS